jgi:flavin-dependent dehydrogenase
MKVCKPDILVIGGGPAGSTFGNLAAQRGWDVVLLEKSEHPRFHIGESLLPMTLPIIDQLGLTADVERIGVRKQGADFTTFHRGAHHHTYHFSKALGDSPDHAFQVRRSEFDQLLYEKCQAAGVVARDRTTVTGVESIANGAYRVTSVDERGAESLFEPRFLVDASGRDTFLASTNGWKHRNPGHASAAIFAHFRNVARRSDDREGDISIYWFEHGWVWMIPLRDDVMSVGAVCDPTYIRSRQESLDKFLRKTLDGLIGTRSRMRDAVQDGPARATGNYSYQSERMTGPGYLVIGDAFAFIDPVFSSGVHLAMTSAARGIGVAGAWLEGGARQYRKACRAFEQETLIGINTFAWFIYRFRSPAMSYLFSHPRNPFRLVEGMISMLAGDVFTNRAVRRRLLVFKLVYAVVAVLLRAGIIREGRAARRVGPRRRPGRLMSE